MVFSSLVFLCIFLPVVFLLYTVVPSLKIKNAILIVASLVFYAYGEPVYVLLMIFSSLMNYIFALFVEHKKYGKFILTISVIVNLLLLGVFKYTGFFIASVNSLLATDIPVVQISLPIGISFFTFQAMSYVIDVYRKTVAPQKNFFNVLLYITFFPQLIAGPIVKYRDIEKQIICREQSIEKVAAGLRRFICGLAKKVLIANTMGQVADTIFVADNSEISVISAWLGAISYLFQIYYDFSGYSDMAIGLGKMFGFDFKENFNYPYVSVNVQDFWRRWHISLSTWFKEYLYIPLGGNRKGRVRTVVNKLIVFLCTGLWHGANWTFVIWGIYHGLFLLLEEFVPIIKKIPRFLCHIYTMLVVTVGFVLFRADTISQGATYIAEMFTGFDISSSSVALTLSQMTPWFIVMLIAAIIGCGPMKLLGNRFLADNQVMAKTQSIVQVVLYILSFVLLLWCIIRLSGTSYNPFIYFRF